MDIHPEDVIISLINITVLFILLRLILWKHVIRFLADRKNSVENEMEAAENHRKDAEALHNKYNEKIGTIEAQGQEIIAQSRQKANEESDKILRETQEKAKELISDARTRIAIEKDEAFDDAQHDITELATQMASHILEREVSAQDNINTVNDFFK